MPKVYGYIRVSHADQARSGLGMAAQKEAIEGYWHRHYEGRAGFTFAGFYEDPAVSGGKPLVNRPAGSKLALAVDSGDIVLFAKLDRGFRDVEDIVLTSKMWSERGVAMVFLDYQVDTSTAIGKVMLIMIAAIAQFERDRMSERSKEAHAQRAKRGGPVGNHTFGFKHAGPVGNRVYLPSPEDRELGKKVLYYRDELGLSWDKIHFEFVKLRIRGFLGKEMYVDQIRYVYDSEKLLRETEEKAKAEAANLIQAQANGTMPPVNENGSAAR